MITLFDSSDLVRFRVLDDLRNIRNGSRLSSIVAPEAFEILENHLAWLRSTRRDWRSTLEVTQVILVPI